MKTLLRFGILPLAIFLSLNSFAQNTIGTTSISENVQEGYTLFAPGGSNSTYLIDNCGNVINQWVSIAPPGLSAYLTPEGNLVRTRRESNNTFFAGGVGGAIEMFNWSGAPTWEFVLSDEQSVLHHDIAILPNGNILAIAYEAISQAEALSLGRNIDSVNPSGIWADKIIEIKPLPNSEHEIVWEWRAIDHIVQDVNPGLPNFGVIADTPGKLNFNYRPDGQSIATLSDWMHSNAIDYNPELDQIILNSRNFSEFFIIDHSTTTEEASTSEGGTSGKGGDFLYRWGNPMAYNAGTIEDKKLFSQHDAHWIDEGLQDGGKVFVFNNGLNRPGGTESSVEIIATPLQQDGSYAFDGMTYGPEASEWVYGLEENDENINSPRISGVGRQPNGNTLITVGSSGNMIELDENNEVVWKYVIPLNGSAPNTQGSAFANNSVFRSYKYPLDYPAFTNNTITVGNPIELEPNIGFCLSLPVENIDLVSSPLELINTLVENELIVNATKDLEIAIIDINGVIKYSFDLSVGRNNLVVNNLAAGMYFVSQINPDHLIFANHRFIKSN